jgi:hypothetical protein
VTVALVRQPNPIGSDKRMNVICALIRQGTNGEFAIVHQDWCGFGHGKDHCSCVPSVWRVDWGKT